MMGPAPVVGTADQPHARFQSREASGSMARAPSQARQSFAHCPVEAFDERRIEFDASCRESQEFLRPLDRALRHAPDDFNDLFFRGFLDHRSNDAVCAFQGFAEKGWFA
jgi:hypothetical protein